LESKEIIGVTELIVFGSVGMITLIVFIFIFVYMYQKKMIAFKLESIEKENKHQKQLLEASIKTEEKERERIAKNLHDDIGTHLNVLKMHLSKIARNANDTNLIAGVTTEAKTLLEGTIEQLRGISQDLMPPVLLNLGFEKAISDLCRSINNSGAICIEILNTPNCPKQDAATELQLYRISIELINNILKHAAASTINIAMQKQGNDFFISIQHNGKAINNEEVKKLSETAAGLGLRNIMSRAQVINADVNYYKEEQGGKITIELKNYFVYAA
jgi:signal transduction histidine kinase